MSSHQDNFVKGAIESKALSFGEFTLKSGRKSPYFFNMALCSSAAILSDIAAAYAHTIANSGLDFDVIFGPAYKGIPLAALAAVKLAEINPAKYGALEFAYNRKEAKDHGEGGVLVGRSIKDRKVLILDDVMTAGTAIRQSLDIIKAEGGTVAGVVIALDRQERVVDGTKSPLQIFKEEHNLPVFSVINFDYLIKYLEPLATAQEIEQMKKYKETYGVN